jgi:hypothetical protein
MTTELRRGLAGFADEIHAWVQGTGKRVPSYARIADEVLALLDDARGEIRAALQAAWEKRDFEASYHRPLLLFAALRADALAEGPGHPLWEAIAAEPPRPEAVTRQAVAASLGPGMRRIYQLLRTRSVQTNETSRAVAWLWPARLLGAAAGGRSVALVDIGCSAGLNLIGDRLPAIWTDPAGTPLPVADAPPVRLRLGLDRGPLDVRDQEAVAWLEACIWPGEPHRLERLRAAVAAMRAAHAAAGPPRLERAEAAAIPGLIEAATRALPVDTLVIAYQTVFIEYLSPAASAAYVAGMRGWLQRAPAAVWLELEGADPPVGRWPALLRATARDPGGALRMAVIARCGYHPSTIAPEPEAVAWLQGL